jgi:hypothetical protein
MTHSSETRRTSARTALFMLVHTQEGTLWAHDIGMGGLLAVSNRLSCVGQFLDLAFRLPGRPELLKVGGQITKVEPAGEGAVALRVRFCNPSPKVQMALYRFLDGRRAMWDENEIERPRRPVPPPDDPRPFAGILLQAFSALRALENAQPDFEDKGPSRELSLLSRVLGNAGSPSPKAA